MSRSTQSSQIYKNNNPLVGTNAILQTTAGVYTYNFLGYELLNSLESFISYMLKEADCQQVRLPTLQHLGYWNKSGRGSGYGHESFVLKNEQSQPEYILAPTAEELACDLISKTCQSYKQLPIVIFQISDKYRNELRPRGDLLRTKEFRMKDAYSFCATVSEQRSIYIKMINNYINIFNAVGLAQKYIIKATEDTGEIGGDMSHEFLVLCSEGDREMDITPVVYKEISTLNDLDTMNNQSASTDEQYRYIEVGHVFNLGKKYSEAMNIQFQSSSNILNHYEMGCYGIGTARMLKVILDNVDYLPECINPYKVYLVARPNCSIYSNLCKIFGKQKVLYNDTMLNIRDKIVLRTQLKFSLMIIYENSHEIKIHIRDEIITYTNEQDVITALQSMV